MRKYLTHKEVKNMEIRNIEIKEVEAPQNRPAKNRTRGLNKLNLSFGIKDFDATRARHATRINTLKSKHVLYSDIIDNYFEDNLLSSIVSSTQWNFFYRELFKDNGRTKSNVRTLKTFINWKTREAIQGSLEYNEISKGYDTAFYVIFYSSINKLLTRITKELLKNYVGG